MKILCIKYLIITYFLFLISLASNGQSNEFTSLHKGKFYYKNEPKVLVKRSKNRQSEINIDKKYKLIFKIKWTSEYDYELIFIKAKRLENPGCLVKGFKIKVKIIETKDDTHEWVSFNPDCGGRQTGIFVRLK
jgi:hypothetical protein